MNNKHILDLTLRLSQSLDQNYDVVNMDTVLSVISALEGATITKEQLEATRLAKYINQLRRRTKCENLARRAKSLLKRWREMVGIQQAHESTTVVGTGVEVMPISNNISATLTASAPYNISVTDNVILNSQLSNPQNSHQHHLRQNQYPSTMKLQSQQPYHSQPSSPVNIQEKSNPNEFLISMSNPATSSQMPKTANTNVRKKRRLEKNINSETNNEQQQPTSFANLLTGLGATFSATRKTTRDKAEQLGVSVKPMETFIIEHSSNSNSDLICLPSYNNVSSNFTVNDVSPVIIDLQDTNSSINSIVSRDVKNASSSFQKTKTSTKKIKKDKKRKERNVTSRQNQPLQVCEDQNTTVSYTHKQVSDVLLLGDKSHLACPTNSNISEILSLSNSSMSSVFPSTDAKNIFHSSQSELASCSAVKMPKSDLTFAGKFNQNTSATTGGCNILNYNADNLNVNILSSNSSNQNKFSIFGGIGTSNSNDSTSNSHPSQFNTVVDALRPEVSNSKQNEDIVKLHEINEKSMSNMSNVGNLLTDNNIFNVTPSVVTPTPQQSIESTMPFASQQTEKLPKKRGRKKGSKGVDSLIAKETSLSSQMLISSLSVAGKKVKTTKELYAEMEIRKLRNVKVAGTVEVSGSNTANLNTQQQHQKPISYRRLSFCSDIAESDSCTMTSEPSRDSGNIINKPISKLETTLDDNYTKYDAKQKPSEEFNNTYSNNHNSILAETSKIKYEIQEMLKLLTPTNSVKEIEYECYNSITPCTCTIEEVIPPIENNCNEIDNSNIITDLNPTNSTNIYKNKGNHMIIKQTAHDNGENKVLDKDPKNGLFIVKPLPPPPAKIKKSIFDLDFEDDEDPLNSIIADITGKNSKPEEIEAITTVVIEGKSEIALYIEDDQTKVDYHNVPNVINIPETTTDKTVPSYEVRYDPDCQAKNRFEVQTQKITKFHINTLHNCFIPNVNGNWNHADVCNRNSNKVFGKNYNDDDCNNDCTTTDGYDVVPLYGSDMTEQIAKDLSHVKFTKQFKPMHSKCINEIFHIPFLGVSRPLSNSDVKLCNKDIQMLKLDEEKENVDKKYVLINACNKENSQSEKKNVDFDVNNLGSNHKSENEKYTNREEQHKPTYKKRIKRKKCYSSASYHSSESKIKMHNNLFYHDELYPMVWNGEHNREECIFQISSCSSGCSADEDATNKRFIKNRTFYASSTYTDNKFIDRPQILDIQQDLIQSELIKEHEISENLGNDKTFCKYNKDDYKLGDDPDHDDLPEDNNRLLLSFNNIFNKSTRDENVENYKQDHESKMLQQQLQNCDDYNNFNLMKYIDNKFSSVNNINSNINNNNNSCSNNYSDTNIIISGSSCSHENPTSSVPIQHKNLNYNDKNVNDVQIKPLKEYQTGIRAVNEDVNDEDGNNCGRLQQFKEWNEVLQLRSYNDELLTVLPYVVLD